MAVDKVWLHFIHYLAKAFNCRYWLLKIVLNIVKVYSSINIFLNMCTSSRKSGVYLVTCGYQFLHLLQCPRGSAGCFNQL